MKAQHSDATNGQDNGLRELTSSMIRFTNAVTLFSMQQMQNALGAVTDSQAVINRFCGALDAISNTLSNQIDSTKKSTLDSMTRTSGDLVDQTFDLVPTPRRVADTAADAMHSFSDVVRRGPNAVTHGHSAEPESAADALGKHKK